ncbi:MAG: bifunctional diaminohydroxyphosphoribosylaminopyrimidine deaminase/5-amino-6-(5-phosphoribosylamino)uracil reductase RibD [Solirubrobacteraceae bacterium]|nr:bifunctional diaminohydroxyphosphoribosylaminopyrimidine deaminase/5-amino-6-(5-phosphoribosylamino)uracil reductase RibD [Solirubrobacteraceae bacterium]
MSTSATDQQLLDRAIELGRRGLGRVSPNPTVGAVIARDGEVLGEGWHREYGGLHAEAEAIAAAGDADLAGATLYVSLEPCCHQGKQPPCTEAILAAGIRRVVVAADDPTEKASGRGLGILRDEGVEVLLAGEQQVARARLENQAFRKHARTGRPWVLFKSAMSLDGKVATHAGDSQWISCPASRERAHHWRAEVDAVVVGIGTALADDPALTARAEGVHRQPRHVVFDATARLPLDSQLVAMAGDVPLHVVVSRAAPRAATEALEMAGATVLTATGEHEPARVVDALGQLGALDEPITSVLLEGGPHLAGAFFDAGEIDEARFFVAPMLIGGGAARDPLEGEGAARISDAMRAMTLTSEPSGDDVLLTARLRVW